VLDELWDANENLTNTQIRNVLAMFLFQGEDVFKPVSKLSGGEKGRVSLSKLMLSDSNLLILDEPTNHLDINSREALEDALLGFDGTILAVSHDRYFINKMATRILEFDNRSLKDIDGNYSFYLDYRSKPEKYGASEAQEKASAAKQEFLDSKEEKARQRRLEKQLADTENEITATEERLKKMDEEMLKANEECDHVMLMQLHEEQENLTKRLEELYELWEQLETQKQ
jgi:ATP-binding cassette subfamily F protein 3